MTLNVREIPSPSLRNRNFLFSEGDDSASVLIGWDSRGVAYFGGSLGTVHPVRRWPHMFVETRDADGVFISPSLKWLFNPEGDFEAVT